MIAYKLRKRVARRSDCETLAPNGGFKDRPFDTLKTDLDKMKGYVDYWPSNAEKDVKCRFITEDSGTPAAVLSEWDQFIRRIAFWPMAGDTDNDKWDPTNPALPKTSLDMAAKVQFFRGSVFRECRASYDQGKDRSGGKISGRVSEDERHR